LVVLVHVIARPDESIVESSVSLCALPAVPVKTISVGGIFFLFDASLHKVRVGVCVVGRVVGSVRHVLFVFFEHLGLVTLLRGRQLVHVHRNLGPGFIEQVVGGVEVAALVATLSQRLALVELLSVSD